MVTIKLIGEKIAKLIEVKSIITFTIIGAVTYGFINGMVQAETYCAFAGSIITYYFLRKPDSEKK